MVNTQLSGNRETSVMRVRNPSATHALPIGEDGPQLAVSVHRVLSRSEQITVPPASVSQQRNPPCSLAPKLKSDLAGKEGKVQLESPASFGFCLKLQTYWKPKRSRGLHFPECITPPILSNHLGREVVAQGKLYGADG